MPNASADHRLEDAALVERRWCAASRRPRSSITSDAGRRRSSWSRPPARRRRSSSRRCPGWHRRGRTVERRRRRTAPPALPRDDRPRPVRARASSVAQRLALAAHSSTQTAPVASTARREPRSTCRPARRMPVDPARLASDLDAAAHAGGAHRPWQRRHVRAVVERDAVPVVAGRVDCRMTRAIDQPGHAHRAPRAGPVKLSSTLRRPCASPGRRRPARGPAPTLAAPAVAPPAASNSDTSAAPSVRASRDPRAQDGGAGQAGTPAARTAGSSAQPSVSRPSTIRSTASAARSTSSVTSAGDWRQRPRT